MKTTSIRARPRADEVDPIVTSLPPVVAAGLVFVASGSVLVL
jgi:hypothetical protein